METIGKLEDGRFVVVLSQDEYDELEAQSLRGRYVYPSGYAKRIFDGIAMSRDIIQGMTLAQVARKHNITKGVVTGRLRLVHMAALRPRFRRENRGLTVPSGMGGMVRSLRDEKSEWLAVFAALENNMPLDSAP